MAVEGRISDAFARLMNDTAGVAQAMRQEIEAVLRSQADRIIADMDLVRREDLEIAKDIAARALAEVGELRQRIQELEGKLPERKEPARKEAGKARE